MVHLFKSAKGNLDGDDWLRIRHHRSCGCLSPRGCSRSYYVWFFSLCYRFSIRHYRSWNRMVHCINFLLIYHY
ncbi:hypothetical protein C0J52_07220 [Blattella germanica]|nr:hypothetical protein C0J52_07220 [Blattella germanica]